MDRQAMRTAYLVSGFIRGTLSNAEHDELDEWIGASDANMKLFEDLTDERNLKENMAWMDKVNSSRSFKKLEDEHAFAKKSIPLKWLAIAAAAILLIIAAFSLYRPAPGNKNPVPLANQTPRNTSDKALLRFSNGKTIDLALAPIGLIDTGIEKVAEGELRYLLSSPVSGGMHNLVTPAGGQYKVTLPDGSMVWLNASTSLSYPASFADSARYVELTGEAYFEVAIDAHRPFNVQLSHASSVKVLGTHFNISSYPNEPTGKVTLLEGRIALSLNNRTQALQPGEQFQLTASSIKKITNPDMDEIMAWKKGLFVFNEDDIHSIMQQVSRWYNVEIIYSGINDDLFTATIERKESLARLLGILELTGKVHFKIQNNKVYVSP
ncbi:MAG TPA: FecR domain-containing protein [Chitinophagaceae bacterium]|nr:FecR domain-containing protein [Chitinophagaceae bacterium]